MFAVTEGEMASKKAHAAHESNDWSQCIEHASAALHTATHSIPLRQLRVDCSLSAGDVEQAAGDLTRLSHLAQPTTEMYTTLSALTYFLLPPSAQAMGALKQCLHGDPDSKVCSTAHRQIKQFDKQFTKLETYINGNMWASVIKHVTTEDGLAPKFNAAMKEKLTPINLPESVDPLKLSPRRRTLYAAACKAFTQSAQLKRGEPWCTELLRMDPDAVDALTAKAEIALAAEDFEEAVRSFERAFEAEGRSQGSELHQRLSRAQRLLKQSKAKDYYKVINVARDADQRTIKKAYRLAAKTAHPDKGGSEAQMAAVNEAYEVLSNPELRARFDNGEDPMDPAAQQSGHPFQQGGGMPFQFFQQGGGGMPFGGGGPFGGGHTFHF